MIIPIRCFTCNQKISNKWELYQEKIKNSNEETVLTTNIIKKIKDSDIIDDNKSIIGKTLDELNITRYCCRRHFIGHVELIQFI